jgi:hypothetical protein
LSERTLNFSPYNYVSNNPVGNTDPDGNVTISEFQYNSVQNVGIATQKAIPQMQQQQIAYQQWTSSTVEGAMYESGRQYAANVTADFYEKASLAGGGSSRSIGDPGRQLTKMFLDVTPIGSAVNSLLDFRAGNTVGGLINLTGALLDVAALRGGGSLSKAISAEGSAFTDNGNNYLYRALRADEAVTYGNGQGIFPKNPNGTWTLEQHLVRGSSPASWLNDPWI